MANIFADTANDGTTRLKGLTDGGHELEVPVTNEGHLEVALHSPRLPFGAIHTEGIDPEFQVDGVYGINNEECVTTTGHLTGGVTSATVSASNNLIIAQTGTTALSFATLQSRKRLRYRPGQGVVGRFTAVFSEPAANSILVAGLGTAESGVFFGYNGTQFGILHSTGGVREIQTLTITTPSTDTNSYTITLGGVAHTITATNNNNVFRTAYEISRGTYTGWKAESIGSTVVFVADSVGNKTGTFSIAQSGAGVPAAGTFAETRAGVAATDTWIPQTDWNGDKLDGNGGSGATLDPQTGNVYQIGIQYLGYGCISFQVEVPHSGNNPDFVTVHTLDFPNSRTSVNLSQPSFPFTMAAYSSGSTTNVSISTASFAGFLEGSKKLNGPNLTFTRETNNFVGSTAATYYPLFTIRNDYIHSHNGGTPRANQSIVNIMSFSGAHDDATPVTFLLIKNATLGGNVNFSRFSQTSCTYWDTSATTATITDNDQLVSSVNTGQASGETIQVSEDWTEILLQPGETLTLAARAVTGTATYANGSLNIREDQ